MERSPMTESPPAMSPATEHPEGRNFFRRESLSVAGARRSTMLASIAGGAVPASTSPSTSPTAPRGIPRSLRNRRGSAVSGSIPSSASGGSVPRASTLGGFGVSFRNVFGGPDEETIIEGGSGSTPGSAASPLGAFSPRHSATLPSMPRRRRSSGVASYHWLSGGAGGETGDEPGVDVRSARDQEAYGHMTGPSHVCVIDYSSDPDAEDTNVRVDFPGKKLGSWLDSSAGKRPMNDEGKPLGVRWIHVTGLNWEVVKTLTLRYQLHPLAVEDALRSGHSPRSKVDYYRTHMYLQLLVHHIHGTDKESIQRAAKGLDEGTTGPSACDRASYDGGSPDDAEPLTRSRWRFWERNAGQIRLPEGVDEVFGPSVPGQVRQTKKRKNPLDNLPPEMDHNTTQRLVIDQLSASYMVPIRKGIISAFIMRDGMMITVCEHDMSEVLEPIYERLEDEHSLLRRSGDVSMLAHALLDVTADLTIEIAQAFEAEILKAESHVLVQAQLEFVRHLFIIQAQITRFRRQLTPLLYACYIIRDQDTARAAAAGALSQGGRRGRGASTSTTMSNLAGPGGTGNSGVNSGGVGGGPGGFGGGPTGGMSPHIGAGPVGLPNIHGWHGPNAGVPGFGIPGVAPASAMTAAGLAGGQGSGGGLGLGGMGNEGLSTAAQGGQGVPSAIPEGGRWTPTEEEMNRRGASSGPSRANSGATTPQPHHSGSNGAGPNPTAAANVATAQAVMNCPPGQVPNSVTGYFSPLAKVYMNDVIDHLEMVVGASEQFVSTSDHLTDYVFNVLSFQTNNSMERLSIVTVIFLPLTFISSYFGMNFTDFVALENNVSYFWKVAAPCTIAFFVIFSFNYLQSAWDTLTRRIQRRQRERDIRAQVQLDG